MAGKTPTQLNDLIAALRNEHAALQTSLDNLEKRFDDADVQNVRERLRHIEAILAVIDVPKLISRVATLEEQVAELKKWREERDRRNWQFWLGVGMVVFTLFVNLFVAPWKR